MRTSAALLTLLILSGTSAPALAAATPEEAQRLTALFQAYLGKEPGVVTVTPAGESYNATFDFGPLLAKIKEPGFKATLTPIDWTITPQGSGKWKVDQDQPLSFSLSIPNQLDMKASIASIKGTGIFDEAIGAFATTSTEITKVGFDQTVTDAAGPTRVVYTIDSMRSETAMVGTADAADGTAKLTFTNLRETVSIPQGAGSPPVEFSITARDGAQDSMVKGLKPQAITDLVAWFIARPTKEAIIAEQAALKDKLRAALPGFSNVSGLVTLNAMAVNTMLGRFAVDKFDLLVDANGIVEDGIFRQKYSFSGLQLPEGLVPPWASGLVPKTLSMDFSVKDFNLAAPARMLIDAMDLSKEPPVPKEMEAQLQQAFMPKGTVTVGMGPSGVQGQIYDFKAEGTMVAGPAGQPSGNALLQLKGIDDIMAAVQAAPPEMGMAQVMPVIIVAKGMAKQEADGYLSWKIESTPTGSVTVNGTDISKMGGQ